MTTPLLNAFQLTEPTATLISGARIYHPDKTTKEAWVELPLSQYFKQSPEDPWKEAAVALIEARRVGCTSVSMGHPSSLIGEVRRWFRDNPDLYEIMKKDEEVLYLVIRPGTETLLHKWHNAQSGTSEYIPINRWSIKVIPK
jgi:hypothetical protein